MRGRWRLAFLIVPLALLAGLEVCKHAAPPSSRGTTRQTATAPRLTESERERITSRYGDIFERTGGDGIWVKRPARPGSDRHQGTTADAVAVPSASRAIVSAFKQQAARDGLRVAVQPFEGSGLQHGFELALSSGSEVICAWRLREAPRLYRAAIVIDDLGEDLRPAQELLQLPYPLTFSVLPGLRASRQVATATHLAGRQVMLHLPMEALPGASGVSVSPGAGAIRVGMPGPEVDRIIEADLDSVPYAAGANNHMGSSATSDAVLMAEVMKALAARRLYFIDSRTTASSVALDAARQAGLPSFYRSVFLDDTQTVEYTLGELRRFRAAVLQQGVALAIGHPHPTTIAALRTFLPELERDDIELVPASELVRLPEVARLSPSPKPDTPNRD